MTTAAEPKSLASKQVRERRLTWLVAALALVESGWLAFDGAHALLTGDYVTPSSGTYAGQLGPWADLVSAVGIPPRSALMKSIHLGLGTVWILATIGFAAKLRRARHAMIACALLTLWYLPFGTVLSAIQLGLLLSPSLRLSQGVRQ